MHAASKEARTAINGSAHRATRFGALLARAPRTERRFQERPALKLLVAGGGTGGHVFPALAVAREWLARGADRQVLFVGTERGLENRLVPPTGIPLEYIRSAGLKGIAGPKFWRNLAQLPGAFRDSAAILRRHRFVAAFGVGGYAAGPVLLLAALRGVPLVIFEPNAEPGFTNRVLARFSKRVATGYRQLARRWRPKAVATGSPLRSEFHRVPLRQPEPPYRLLITGGSQGARALNRAVIEALPLLTSRRQDFEIVHQTGERDRDSVRTAYALNDFHAEVQAFLTDMAQRLAWADLVICRAGQITIAELAAVGRPAIFIPFAAAADSHQLRNAEALARDGAARIVQEGEASGARLAQEVLDAVDSAGELCRQAERIAAFARPGAAQQIVDLIEQAARP
jgi:UDP-N-acetylglucosamine--N-acetylmuramyl-(pentapeptide) pyrophosphoryl-undecaprenol N-acetylglucosamine transferase